MNIHRRKILLGILGYKFGLIVPSLSVASNFDETKKNTCHIRQETQNIIRNIYGNTASSMTDRIFFEDKDYTVRDGGVFITENGGRIKFSIKIDAAAVHGPITFIMEKYHSYNDTFKGSEYVAQYQTDGSVTKIEFFTDVNSLSTKIKMYAISKLDKSVVYSCHQVITVGGDEGCC
jgi:hypothetical protein